MKHNLVRYFSYCLLLVSSLYALSACKDKELIESRTISSKQSYSFVKDIKPILDQKCLACHSCYDAPCQLKLESAAGADRGASKEKVYDGSRLKDMTPTRLYIDAQSPQEWRNKGFYSVLSSYTHSKNQSMPPLMLQMLELGYKKPLATDKKIPEDIQLGFERKNYCPTPGEFKNYQEKYPHGGMPLAVTGLDEKEYQALTTWLKQGAKIDSQPPKISDTEQALIIKWENWLNQKDNRSKLLSRYIYEHIFLGHLYLTEPNLSQPNQNNPTQFYRLIRSLTPTGEKPATVETIRPNDDPEKPFFYRLVPIEDTIVHKTHITYRFDSKRLNHYKQLFYAVDWNVKKLPDYTFQERANPFITFADIPAKQRYIFLLDDAEFFVRNFIRGPVCRGQIATNVIRDQFWVMFEDPETELYTNKQKYQLSVNKYLGLPGENTSLIDLGKQWLTYKKDRNRYLELRQKSYQQQFPSGAELEHIWDGNESNDNAFLTVFRHHNSASVTKGFQGEFPLTAWLMDYPLLERTYYELVVGFDVFGSVSHQAQTRLYFDLIRNGSEANFLRFMPANSRQNIYENWYQAAAKIKTEITYHDLDLKTATNVSYKSKQPKQELLETLLDEYPILTENNDPINRCNEDCESNHSDPKINSINLNLTKISSKPAAKLSGIKWLPEVSFVKINLVEKQLEAQQPKPKFLVYSLLRNRRHSNVAFMIGEKLRYQEELDTLTIIPEPIGSYPNLIFQVNASEIENFVLKFKAIDSDVSFDQFIQRWGIRRMSPDFWNVFHSIKDHLQDRRPLEAGVYDMNRYGNF